MQGPFELHPKVYSWLKIHQNTHNTDNTKNPSQIENTFSLYKTTPAVPSILNTT